MPSRPKRNAPLKRAGNGVFRRAGVPVHPGIVWGENGGRRVRGDYLRPNRGIRVHDADGNRREYETIPNR